MSVPPRINLVTLGVADVARSREFYESLGWQPAAGSTEEITFFQLGGVVLGIFGRAALAEDAQVAPGAPGAFSGVTLAINVPSEDAVTAGLAAAEAAGAKILKPGQKVFWGGFSGYFADPDGHAWEMAHNPFWKTRDDGTVVLE